MSSALTIYAGQEARQRIQREGWQPDLFSLLIGASGGPKWFVLRYLDELLFGDFLARGTQPLNTIGSSIGSWQHLCLNQADPLKALDILAKRYCEQSYSTRRPTPLEITAVCNQMLNEICAGEDGDPRTGLQHMMSHPRYHSHVVTARGGHFTGSPHTPLLLPSLGVAALANGVHRRLLAPFFQRVVFSNRREISSDINFNDFGTLHVPFTANNSEAALMASGSIPFVLAGERNIKGGPQGQYWDGGIIDYHFNLDFYSGDGLILYPHFSSEVTPGWFDKSLPWRRGRSRLSDKLVLICPSAEFIASLPGGKLPDRTDFQKLEPDERVKTWYAAMEQSRVLQELFAAQLEKSNPLEDVRFLPTEFA